jgi:transposase
MLPNVQQATIKPIISDTVASGTLIDPPRLRGDEYDTYARLPAWGYGHKAVCHADGEYARDEGWQWFLRGPCQHH